MKISEHDFQRLQRFYHQPLSENGPQSPKSLRWPTLRNQYVRFNALCHVGDLNGSSILDLGCGLGDLYGFLKQDFTNFSYWGIDVLPEMIKEARKKYPGVCFECAVLADIRRPFDYILASGAMSFKIAQGKEFYYEMVRQMYGKAKNAVAFNILEEESFLPDDDFQYYSVEDVEKVCASFADDYRIVTGYLPGDATFYLYKPVFQSTY